MTEQRIEYWMRFADGDEFEHSVILDCEAGGDAQIDGNWPDWARLEYQQCEHCPLDPATTPYCPVATNLVPLTRLCSKKVSHDAVEVRVRSDQRLVCKETTVQRAISSLLGLCIATSDCPHTFYLRTMARFHLPFANEIETLFRFTSSYLLAQYYRGQDGEDTDLCLSGLRGISQNLTVLNRAMAERLRAATERDAAVNAIVILDLFAKAMPYCIEDKLEEMRELFEPFLSAEHDEA